MRVYELAKELNLSSKELLAKLRDLDIEVKSHSSSLTEPDIDPIRSADSTLTSAPDASVNVEGRNAPGDASGHDAGS